MEWNEVLGLIFLLLLKVVRLVCFFVFVLNCLFLINVLMFLLIFGNCFIILDILWGIFFLSRFLLVIILVVCCFVIFLIIVWCFFIIVLFFFDLRFFIVVYFFGLLFFELVRFVFFIMVVFLFCKKVCCDCFIVFFLFMFKFMNDNFWENLSNIWFIILFEYFFIYICNLCIKVN